MSSILDRFDSFTEWLLNNKFYDEIRLSELIKDIDENDREAKLERIVQDLETRDPEVIEKFAILFRKSGLVNEESLASQDESDCFFGIVKHITVRFKDLLSSPKACGEELTVIKATKIKSTKDGDVYNMTSRPRGICLIIDNHEFNGCDLSFRTGSRADADRLFNVFNQLGFDVFRYVNQTVAQMETLLKRLSINPELANHDALAVIILSHGKDDEIYGTDGGLIAVADILSLFNNINCRLMINKPKMFFLSACRGSQVDSGTEYSDMKFLGTDSFHHLGSPQSLSGSSIQSTTVHVPTWGDMFVYYSTVSGFASLRNVNTGSWFGYALAHALAKYAHREHLNDLVTTKVGEVLHEKTSHENGSAMKQAIESTTKGYAKKLYFNPGLYLP